MTLYITVIKMSKKGHKQAKKCQNVNCNDIKGIFLSSVITFLKMIPNIIPKYLTKGANFSYEEVDPGAFGQMNLQANNLEKSLNYEDLDYEVRPPYIFGAKFTIVPM